MRSDPTAGSQPSGLGSQVRGAVVVAVISFAVTQLLTHWLSWRRSRRHREGLLDETLDETFPASDPPASQNFDTPVNRQE